MNLLTPNQVKKQQVDENNESILLRSKTEGAIITLNKKLNKLKDIYAQAYKKLKENYTEEFEVKIQAIKGLSEDVAFLEEKRRKALVPVKAREERVKQEAIKVQVRENMADEREGQLIDRQNKLSEDLEKIDDLRDEIEEREGHVKNEEAKQDGQRKMIVKESQQLKEKSEEKWALIYNKEEEILIIRRNLNTREKSLKVLNQENESQKEEIAKDRLHLQSQQQSLKLAFDEARKRNLL